MRVLLVENRAPLRRAVFRSLREAGYVVDVTGDGEEGLWYAAVIEYDVIALDLALPGTDGLTILRRLRGAGQKAPVLIFADRDAAADLVRGLDLGADDCLVKPFALDELLARMRALVRRKYGHRAPVLRVADLEIDTVARAVSRGGEKVRMTVREYALLEFLALHRREVVTRTEIWEHLYPFDSSAQSNVVDVYISYLRRKIDRPGLPRLIHTRRGHGYVLGEAP